MRIEITESISDDRKVVVSTGTEHDDSVMVGVVYTYGRDTYYGATLNRASALALSLAIKAVLAEMDEDDE